MQPKEKIILGYGNIANYITLFGLLLSLLSCFYILGANIKLSISFFIASGICDLFDGVIARKIKRTEEGKEYGIQLDTAVDVISFGITPVIILFSIVGAVWYALFIYAFYMVCAVSRLAYFNTFAVQNSRKKDSGVSILPHSQESRECSLRDADAISRQKDRAGAVNVSTYEYEYYRGLPVTYIALILPIVLLFHSAPANIITLAVVGTLFVLNIKVPKPRGVWYVLFPAVAIVLIVLWWCL